jgi:polyhydroxyalkanoate synthesis regulator phasin
MAVPMSHMTRRRKVAVASGAGALVLVVAGLGAAGAIAGSRMLSPNDESQAVIDDAAAQLGIEPSALSDALKQALENRIDEAVESGKLTEEQADRLKERLESSEVPLLFGPIGPPPHGFGFGFGPGRGGYVLHFGILETAASYLGMTEAELREALHDQTLAQIANEKGKTTAGLVDELVATQTKRIDEAADEGKLTDEQAADLKEGLEARMQALVEGELRRPSDGRHRFWPGSGSPRAPPAFGGPSA